MTDFDPSAAAERELVAAAAGGRNDAFAELVRRNEAKIRSLCLAVLGNGADADDAAQESFLKAYAALSRFRSESRFSTWIYRIAYRHCLDRIRSKRSARIESLEALFERRGDRDSVFASAEGPISPEDKELVHRALALLSPDHRAILWMKEGEGRRYDEIAESLGISLDGVKSKLYRAREALREAGRHFSDAEPVKGKGTP